MEDTNPYASPCTDLAAAAASPTELSRVVEQNSATGTIVPRFLAASVDQVLGMVLGVVAAKSLPDSAPIFQFVAATAVFLAYFFLSEWLLSRTPGKFVFGLVVRQKDGDRITAWQSLVRTLFRAVEVNPFLLGAIPAAVCIIFSKQRQRIGDVVGGTVVVLAATSGRPRK
jgi:uncharacterized RDD family membrane protein YckC